MTYSILLVAHDIILEKRLKELLPSTNYTINRTDTVSTALTDLKKSEHNSMLLDISTQDTISSTTYNHIKKIYPNLAIIFLIQKENVATIVQKYHLGTDDYTTKPISPNDLLTKIDNKLSKSITTNTSLVLADVELNAKKREVKRAGKHIKLTPQEFKLLQYLMQNKDHILTREMILRHIWLYSSDVETRVVDVYMGYLRKKIDKDFSKKLLHSVRGFGYVMKE